MLTQRMREYEDELERYIPVLMAQAQMFWDQGQYSNVLAVLQQSKEFVSENETWKLNLAHTFFMLVCQPFCAVKWLNSGSIHMRIKLTSCRTLPPAILMMQARATFSEPLSSTTPSISTIWSARAC